MMPFYGGAVASASGSGSLKRKASVSDVAMGHGIHSSAKRPREDDYSVRTPPESPHSPLKFEEHLTPSSPCPAVETSHIDGDRIADIANEHLGREILVRHQELRFINQELAKCQAALEQLRRCHLIPYPTSCPTPQQMLDILDGKVPALQIHSSAASSSPQWAPPFGVVDGPYARHYAKWLIPDPSFDGQLPEWCPTPEATRHADGRSTRNSLSAPEGATIGKRVARGQFSHNPPTTTPAKEKKIKVPQTIKRKSDGATVKLVCPHCHRENFCSVQGFMNHVRISHGESLASHEHAAIRCGEVIDENGVAALAAKAALAVKEKKVDAVPFLEAPTGQVPTGIIHPLAAVGRHAVAQLDQNPGSVLTMFPDGVPGVGQTFDALPKTPVADVASRPSKSFAVSPTTPSLSLVLQKRGFEGDLSAHVEDAKIKIAPDEHLDDEDDDDDENELGQPAQLVTTNGVRPVPAMRIPSPHVPLATPDYDQSSRSVRGQASHLSLNPTASSPSFVPSPTNDEDAFSAFGHSPNTATVKNKTPSLVSDSGDDESDDGASPSDAGDTDLESMEENVAEVNPEYHEDHLAQHAAGTSNRAKTQDEDRHVTFVASVPGKPSKGARRKPNVEM